MKYITGLICFGIPCEEDSVGTWTFSKKDFSNPEYMIQKESEDSLFKDYGIEKDKIIQYYGDDTLFNVAGHTRAYLDLIEDGEFNKLHGLFYEYIQSKTCRHAIFRKVYDCLRFGTKFHDINSFMSEEFGNAWMSYVMQRVQQTEDIGGAVSAECVSTGQSAGI